mmetsp:Transcript_19077/g.21873  ORF Transcript_19077/g.21873 Transcript_19077/m.21873 type:complete len:187 (+) Transcript_19077:46-606(+)
MASLYSRPHLRVDSNCIDIAVSLDAIRQLPSFDAFVATLKEELADVYGESTLQMNITDNDPLSYATIAGSGSFSNSLNARIFDLLRQYDAAHAEATQLRAAYEEMLAARPPPPKVEPKFDENGEEIPPPPKSKKALREEAEQKKRDSEALKAVLTKEHESECASIKLQNAFLLKEIRVPVRRTLPK